MFVLPDYKGLKAHVVREVFDRVRRRTPVDTGRAQAGWEVSEDIISNDVEYIGHLENGTSKMRPFAMVKTTLEEVPSIIDDYLSRSR